MTENYIKIPKTGAIEDQFALKKDKRKAYQIFALSGISSIVLTLLMYFI